jgi:beta-glucosidase
LNNILAAKGKSPADGMTANGDTAMVADFALKFDDKTYSTSTSTGAEIVNQFDFADLNYYWEDVTYMTRSNWVDTFPTHLELTAPAQLISDVSTEAAYLQENPEDEAPVMGENIGLQLISLQGIDYDDPEWDVFLNQLTASEMFELIQLDGWRTMATPSVGNPGSSDQDGPQGISASIGGIGDSEGTSCMAYPSTVVLAASFNADLALRMGTLVGEEGLYADITGWYAPAINTHRNAFAGRNFEYYSEDPVLAGTLACQQILGAQSKGMICYVKHFALNDQETNRHSYSSFANEQSIREIYLRAFEIAIVGADAKAVMSSYQRIGARWAGSCSQLLNSVLRDEWGFDGTVLTDSANIGYANMHILSGIGNGNDMWLNTNADNYKIEDMASRPTLLNAMRQACHRVLYNIVNSSAMNGVSKTSEVVSVIPMWMTCMYLADAVILIACLIVLWLSLRSSLKVEGNSKAVRIAVPVAAALIFFLISYFVFNYIAYLAVQSF